jgi:hypothetical protein
MVTEIRCLCGHEAIDLSSGSRSGARWDIYVLEQEWREWTMARLEHRL